MNYIEDELLEEEIGLELSFSTLKFKMKKQLFDLRKAITDEDQKQVDKILNDLKNTLD